MKVLLVDDSRSFRDRLKRYLAEDAAVDVTGEADDGVAALREIERLRPDVILLDLYMPVADGFEVLRAVRERDHTVKIIVLTSDASAMIRQWCATLGADAVIDKGDALAEILPTLHRLTSSPPK